MENPFKGKYNYWIVEFFVSKGEIVLKKLWQKEKLQFFLLSQCFRNISDVDASTCVEKVINVFY